MVCVVETASSLMPALTRTAARQLCDQTVGTRHLVMRASVTSKVGAVWQYRNNIDIYTERSRADTMKPECDHSLECQLVEMALVRAFSDHKCVSNSMATIQATNMLRAVVNDHANLNVTSAKVNQGKKGPFTAALNRVCDDRLRTVHIDQLVRQGRGGWMIDGGTWAKIEKSVVQSYDQMDTSLRGGGIDALPAASQLVDATMEELQQLLHSLGLG